MKNASLTLKSFAQVASVFLMAASLSSCSKHSTPNMTYMPDMAFSPALKAQEEGSMRVPVKGTVPRNFKPYAYFQKGIDVAGQELKNPAPFSKVSLLRGQVVFNSYCKACHGEDGQGGGTIVPKFQRPPSLHSDKIRNYTDGQIFHVMTVGQNIMPSYAAQVSENDRWAVVNYIRVLQRSQAPTEQDLKSAAAQN
jgi:mono/diheme cytochrome c family protein